MARAMALGGLILLSLSCSNPYRPVETGLDILLKDPPEFLKGQRIGLITNHTALTRDGRHIVDALYKHPDFQLVALFAPEHGIRGDVPAGEWVPTYTDSATGLPVFSLYGKVKKPSSEMLQNVDVLMFDIQDIGTRFYTYISTMAGGMEAAAQKGIPFVVLDRPNPITGAIVEGPVLELRFRSFVGLFPIPIRHGMTAGELAHLINEQNYLEGGQKVELHILRMRNWRRLMWFDQTGLRWIKTSPNMPFLQTAILYPGVALLEGTNVSEGRGTSRPFQFVGAPWIDSRKLIDTLKRYRHPGISFRDTTFTPVSIPQAAPHPKYENELCHGLFLEVTDRNVFRSVRWGVMLLWAIHKIHPDRLEFTPGFDRLAGTDRLRQQIQSGMDPRDILRSWQGELYQFQKLRRQHLLYQ